MVAYSMIFSWFNDDLKLCAFDESNYVLCLTCIFSKCLVYKII